MLASPKVLALLFALSAAVLLFDNLGGSRTFAYHEVRAVVPAREMLATGDWTVPRFAGRPRLAKPPLVYWMLATLGGVCGEIDEFTARCPQAVAAVLLCLLMGLWARTWYGKEAGWIAAFVQLTSVWLLVWGRKAEVDMTIWLLTTAALFLVATQRSRTDWQSVPRKGRTDWQSVPHRGGRRNFFRWAGVYALLAIAWLGKFHYAPAMVLAPVGVYLLLQKRYRAFWNFANPLGLVLLSAAVFVWPLLVLRDLPGAWEIWQHETIGRAAGELGREPVWYYLPPVLSFVLPWTPFALLAIRQSWRRAWQDGDPRERFLWVWFLTQFAIVSLQSSKRSHYIICALPVATLLATQTVATLLQRVREGRWRITRVQATTVSLGVSCAVAGSLYFVLRKHPVLMTPILAIGGLVTVGCFIGLHLAAANRHVPARLTALAVFLAGWAIINHWVIPARDHRRELVAFAESARQTVGDGVPIFAYFMSEDPTIGYLGQPVRRVTSPGELKRQSESQTGTHVVTYREYLPQIQQAGRCRIVRSMPADPGNRSRRHSPLVLLELERDAPARQSEKLAGESSDSRTH